MNLYIGFIEKYGIMIASINKENRYEKKLVSLLLVSMFGSMLIAPSTTKLLTAAAEEIFTVHYAEYIPEHTQEFVSKFNSEIMKNVKKGEDIDENALLKASSVEFVCQIYNLAKDAYRIYTINYTKGGINGQKTVVFAKIADGWSEIDNDEHAEACWIDIPSASSDTNLAQYNRFTSSYIWRVNVI